MPDLPIVPCYKADNCGKEFQCGTSKCKPDDPMCYQNLGSQGTIPAGFSGECWGWDVNACDGILSCCDPNESVFSCKSNVVDPALSIRGKKLGCKIGESDKEQVGSCSPIPNQKNDICMEFKNDVDLVTESCQKNCWAYGGKALTDKDCKQFINQSECNAMPYFCSWSGKSCGAIRTNFTQDPYDFYKQQFNSEPPKDPVKYTVVENCEALGLTHGLNCIESPNLITNNRTATVSCSQSAWDTTKKTSYDPRTRICCLETCTGNNCKKKCLATHRCQYVAKTTDCSIKNGEFVCGDVFFRVKSGDITGGQIVQGSGYCTWCQNQSKHPQDDPPKPPDGYIQREPTEWITTSGNRCSSYNQCEAESSEELWNKCIFEKLTKINLSDMAVDPQILVGLTNDEKTKILREKGFCLSASAPDNVRNAVQECEKELSYMGSISGLPSISPGGVEVQQCAYSYIWNHKCQPADISAPQLAENYVCTWCPSLMCKKGPSSEICSNIDSKGTCTTNDTFGEIINPSKWDPDCGCFANKKGIIITPDTKAGIIGGTIGGGTAVGLIVLLVLEFL